jgi:hypothetical protein
MFARLHADQRVNGPSATDAGSYFVSVKLCDH